MIRTIKMVGLSLVALLVVGVSSASAVTTPAEFTSEKAPVTLTATSEGNHVFDAAGNTITCTGASFHGTSDQTTELFITMKGGYTGCTFFGVNVTVNMNTCDYVFWADNTVDVVCTKAGDGITFTASTIFGSCKVTVGAQENLSKTTYTNIGTGPTREVTLDADVRNIAYTKEGSLCGSQTEGRYTSGPTKVTGEEDEVPNPAHIGVFFDAAVTHP